MVPEHPVNTLSDGTFSSLTWPLGEIPDAARTRYNELAHCHEKGVVPEPTKNEIPENSSSILIPFYCGKWSGPISFNIA